MKYILSISGGGVKGAIVSQFLKKLEEYLIQEKNTTIYEQFDLFGGTSIGSIIIGGLVYPKLNATQINDNFFTVENCQKLMNKNTCDRIFNLFQMNPMYTGKEKRNLISSIIGDCKLNSTDKCVIIPTYNVTKNKPQFFKSFEGHLKHHYVKDAIDASSAAPGYFPSVKINNDYYIDGGICCNSPTDCIYANALKKYGPNETFKILSIGTGYKKEKTIQPNQWGMIQWILKGNLLNTIFSSTEEVVDYRVNVFKHALNHEYIHINEPIPNDELDDTSPENIQQLKLIGNEWWEKYKNEIKHFFNH